MTIPDTLTTRTGDPATTPARPPLHAARTLTIGPYTVDTPVVLAPMAGITNVAYRLLCREYGERFSVDGGGIYVSEMVTSRALVERTPESMRLIETSPREHPRSIQLYGVDPATVRAAVTMLVEEDRADHIDLNFGCPVPKVTRRGGGAVLPWKTELFTQILRAAVEAAGPVPVTMKTRMGIDAEHRTDIDAGLIAQEVGVSAIALHGRTAAQHYSGHAHWEAIAALKQRVTDIPVLGNGDIWSAEDALDLVAQSGCDGVVVGRGCLGRPWLFADLAAAFHGLTDRLRPGLSDVADAIMRHADLLVAHYGDEGRAVRDLRKHMSWYMKGYSVGSEMRGALHTITDRADLRAKLDALDLTQPYPGVGAEGPRGRAGNPKRPAVPDGWMDSRDLSDADRSRIREAELSVSGG